MLRIGIVGSENSHTKAFAQLLNVTKRVSGARVVALWGEEESHTAQVASDCLIPDIVKRPEDLVGKVDAAIVDHRHPKFHVPAATPLVDAGIPVLVDKPFSYTVDEGKELLRLAKKKKVVVTSYSCVRYAQGFRRVHQARKKLGQILAADFVGPCDINSQYGGVFFYGVHQTEMMVDALGAGAESVSFARGSGGCHTVTVAYGDGGPIVTLHLLTGYHAKFGWGLYGPGAAIHEKLQTAGLYRRGLEAFLRMVATGKNDWSPEQILTSVAVLAAVDRAMKSGRQETVEGVSL